MKKFSIYHFLVAIMAFSLIMPAAGANAEPTDVGSLTIHKFEQEPGSKQGNGDGSEITDGIVGDALEGVTFTLTQTHSYDPETDEWTEVNGTPFTRVTNTDGTIVLNDIDLGRYKVQETAGPANVVLNKQEYFVDIPMTSKDGSNVNYDVHVYPKNETVKGSVIFNKYDGDTDSKLNGVTFDLHHPDGTVTQYTTGTVDGEDGVIKIDNLPYGDYYFQETGTVEGYLINGEKVEFSIDTADAGKIVDAGSLANYKKPEVEKEVSEPEVNRGDTVTYTITVKLPGDIADYDNFVITDVLHANLDYVDGSQSGPTGFDFAVNGKTLTWTANGDVTPGEVEITFNAVISEDATANESINNEATIDYNNGYESGGDKGEIPVFVHTGSLVVIKEDGNNNSKLAGAEFELKDAAGNVVATGTSGANGVVDFRGATDELNYGDYTLVETKAPEGYNKLRNPIDVTIDGKKSEVTLTVDNYKGGWTLPKTGGIGTLLFTLIGLTLMGSAAFLFIRRRRGEVA